MDDRKRIYNLSGKLNDDDRQELAVKLVKAGYAVRLGKELKGRAGSKGTYQYFVEFWKEEDQ